MASWVEIDRLRKDPPKFKSLAAHLLKLPDANWAEYVERFLKYVAGRPDTELSTRQAKFLLKLRDDKATHFTIGGFSVAILIKNCFQARFDLNDDRDVEFIASLHNTGRRFVTGRQLGWFVRICKELGEIERYVHV